MPEVHDRQLGGNRRWRVGHAFGHAGGALGVDASCGVEGAGQQRGELDTAMLVEGELGAADVCLGASNQAGEIILLRPDTDVPVGARIH